VNPSAQDILRGCVQNLEELVMPEIGSPHGKSALMCIRMLMNHVILRLEHEGAALEVDCHEKRDLFSELLADHAISKEIADAAIDMLGTDEPSYTPIQEMTARNDAWKRLVEQTLGDAGREDVRALVRRQLRAQIERENSYCGPALDGPMF